MISNELDLKPDSISFCEDWDVSRVVDMLSLIDPNKNSKNFKSSDWKVNENSQKSKKKYI